MSNVVGVVYKWKEQFFSTFWKKYFLSLDEKTGRLLYVKRSGEIKGHADLRKIFFAIYCRQLQPLDHRLTKTRMKFAPYTLIIPMFEKNTHRVENQEFALGSLDELETWMRKFAECVGALERFQQMEMVQGRQAPTTIVTTGKPGFRGARFNTTNRYGYEYDYYPLLWASFVADEQMHHHGDLGHCHNTDNHIDYTCGDGNSWSETPFHFTECSIIDPSTGMVTDPGVWSTSCGDDSGAFWSSFLGSSDSGGWDSGGGGGDSGGGFSDSGGGFSDSGGGGGFSDSGGGGGCDSGGGGGGCD